MILHFSDNGLCCPPANAPLNPGRPGPRVPITHDPTDHAHTGRVVVEATNTPVPALACAQDLSLPATVPMMAGVDRKGHSNAIVLPPSALGWAWMTRFGAVSTGFVEKELSDKSMDETEEPAP